MARSPRGRDLSRDSIHARANASSSRRPSSRSRVTASSTSEGAYPAVVRRLRTSATDRERTSRNRAAASSTTAGSSTAARLSRRSWWVTRRRPPGPELSVIPDSGLGDALDRDRHVGDLGPDQTVDLGRDRRVRLEELLRRLATLTEPGLPEGEPGAGLGDRVHRDSHVEQAALLGHALAVHDVELGHAEGRRDLVLDDLDADPVADRLGPGLDRLDAPDVEPDRGVELHRPAARGRLGVAEHDPDLLAQLVREDQRRVRSRDRPGQLAQRLAHQPRLDAHERVAHLALDLGPRDERGDRVDHDAVDAARTDQGLRDLERLLAGVRLADEELIDIDSARSGIARVERVLDIDERDDAAAGLCFGEDVLTDGRLARGLGAEDLRDAATRDAADAERQIEGDRARRDGVEHELLAGSELHDRAAPELLLYRREGGVDRLAPFCGVPLGCSFFRHRHLSVTLLIRSIGPLAGGTSQASVRRSAFLCCVVLDDVSFLARLADHLDVLRWLRQRRQARLAGLRLRLLLLFAGSIPGAHRSASASLCRLPIDPSRRLHADFTAAYPARAKAQFRHRGRERSGLDRGSDSGHEV